MKFVGVISERGGGAIPPLISLAEELQKRGHHVAMICDQTTQGQVVNAKLEPIPVPEGLSLASYFGPEYFKDWSQILASVRTLDGVPNPLQQWSDDCISSIEQEVARLEPNFIFTSLFTLCLARDLSKRTGVPWCFVNPAYVFGAGAGRTIEQDFTTGIPTHLFSKWILPSVEQADLVLHATDQEYDPVTSDLPANHHHVGPLNLMSAGHDIDFLDLPGHPWALVSVSTGPQVGELEIVRNAVNALQDQPLRVLVTAPKRASELEGDFGGNVTVRDFAPHDEVLKRSRLFVTHAGHGSVMKGLIHGVPMVLVPWGRDQAGVAWRAEQLGVGVVVKREELSIENMLRAIESVLQSTSIQRKSKVVAERLAAEDPVARACELLEREAAT